jgi:hypothetical protein
VGERSACLRTARQTWQDDMKHAPAQLDAAAGMGSVTTTNAITTPAGTTTSATTTNAGEETSNAAGSAAGSAAGKETGSGK